MGRSVARRSLPRRDRNLKSGNAVLTRHEVEVLRDPGLQLRRYMQTDDILFDVAAHDHVSLFYQRFARFDSDVDRDCSRYRRSVTHVRHATTGRLFA
jgi:hypothetical protein